MASYLQILNTKKMNFYFYNITVLLVIFHSCSDHIQIITERDWSGEPVFKCRSIFSFYLIFKLLLLSELLMYIFSVVLLKD